MSEEKYMEEELSNFVTVIEDLACGSSPEWEVQTQYVDNSLDGRDEVEQFTYTRQTEDLMATVIIEFDDVVYELACTEEFHDALKDVIVRQAEKQGIDGMVGLTVFNND